MPKTPLLKDFIPPDLQVSNPSRNLHHIFDEQDCYALWAAYSAGRPLLVRGATGTGKSQMAKAIAEQLGWAFVSETVRGSTELSDLHWHFDAIGRLGEAQARAMPGGKCDDSSKDKLDPIHFLSPGVFWWAYDWQSAKRQYDKCTTHTTSMPELLDSKTEKGQSWNAETGGVVLLLDEIDKAEPDLPNGLLETLGSYRFTVPYIKQCDQSEAINNPVMADPSKVLVVITTNEERELPKAFVRRCFVHTLKMEESAERVDPDDADSPTKRLHWLMERGRLHFGSKIAELVYQQAAELLWQDRLANPHTQYPPGLAEYIDLLKALQGLTHKEQINHLDKISRYALKKDLEK